MAERVKPSPERTELMRIARKAGKTYVEIGAAFGLSSSQVERIIGKKSKAQRTYNVSNPVRTPLDPAKCGTTAQARAVSAGAGWP